jgi:hypothetical protein
MLQLTFPRKDTYTILITYFPQIYCMVLPVNLYENKKRIYRILLLLLIFLFDASGIGRNVL